MDKKWNEYCTHIAEEYGFEYLSCHGDEWLIYQCGHGNSIHLNITEAATSGLIRCVCWDSNFADAIARNQILFKKNCFTGNKSDRLMLNAKEDYMDYCCAIKNLSVRLCHDYVFRFSEKIDSELTENCGSESFITSFFSIFRWQAEDWDKMIYLKKNMQCFANSQTTVGIYINKENFRRNLLSTIDKIESQNFESFYMRSLEECGPKYPRSSEIESFFDEIRNDFTAFRYVMSPGEATYFDQPKQIPSRDFLRDKKDDLWTCSVSEYSLTDMMHKTCAKHDIELSVSLSDQHNVYSFSNKDGLLITIPCSWFFPLKENFEYIADCLSEIEFSDCTKNPYSMRSFKEAHSNYRHLKIIASSNVRALAENIRKEIVSVM